MLKITEQQLRVAKLLAEGRTNAEVASALGLSIKTIDSHRGQALTRLGLRNNVELTHYALRRGWVALKFEHIKPENQDEQATQDETPRP